MKRNVPQSCGHVVEWSSETESEIAFGFFCVEELWSTPCPWCGGLGGPVEPFIREVRVAGARFGLPELVARRL